MKQIIITTLFALATMAGQAQEKCDSIPFIYHSHIYIPVVINDSIKCNTIYDTGAAGMFGVDSVFLSHSAWKPQKMGHAMMSDMIVIGSDTIHRKSISYLPEGTGAFGKKDYVGIIGNGIWSDYNIIIDARNSVLYLRRFKPATPEGPTYDYSFRNRTDICRGWIVSSLVRDGDAVKAGMELGDTITAVNGKSVSEYSWDEEDNLSQTPKQILTITTANGQEKHITLEAKEQWF